MNRRSGQLLLDYCLNVLLCLGRLPSYLNDSCGSVTVHHTANLFVSIVGCVKLSWELLEFKIMYSVVALAFFLGILYWTYIFLCMYVFYDNNFLGYLLEAWYVDELENLHDDFMISFNTDIDDGSIKKVIIF